MYVFSLADYRKDMANLLGGDGHGVDKEKIDFLRKMRKNDSPPIAFTFFNPKGINLVFIIMYYQF